MARILLHTCCASCLLYPLERLKENSFEVVGLFYNPNVHPFAEYQARKQALQALPEALALEMFYPEYLPEDFFRAIHLKETPPLRCRLCWRLRLKKTARLARENGFPYFSSTLLVSPYQDQEALKSIGGEVAKDEGVDFYYEDFRPGFPQAQSRIKSLGIYRQRYCGCIFSEIVRCRKSPGC